jgi:hypothetical protein
MRNFFVKKNKTSIRQMFENQFFVVMGETVFFGSVKKNQWVYYFLQNGNIFVASFHAPKF